MVTQLQAWHIGGSSGVPDALQYNCNEVENFQEK
jgi:hypothetical protein